MEYKRIYLPFHLKISIKKQIRLIEQEETKETAQIDKVLKKHLEDGWEIISTSPIIKSFSLESNNNYTYTSGIEVFLVRKK